MTLPINYRELDEEPRYPVSDVLRILGVPSVLFQLWTVPQPPGSLFYPIIQTHADPADLDGADPYVTFPALAEAHMLAAFARSDMPARAAWTATTWLTRTLGTARPLISEHLAQDGAAALLAGAAETTDPAEREILLGLVLDARASRPQLGPLLGDRVRGNLYRQGAVCAITLDGYGATTVVVDRHADEGAPTIAPHHAPLAEVLRRVRAGEPAARIIGEHRLTATELHDVLTRHDIPVPA